MQPKCVSDVHMCRCNDTAPDTSLPFSISIDKKLHILSRPALDGPDGTRDAPRWPGVEEVTKEGDASPAPGTPKGPQEEGGSNNILAYVSILAAVVLGLLLYVAYKW